MSEQHSTRIVVNGQEYHGVEEMPPEVRSLYERAMQMAAEQGGTGQGPGAGASLPPLSPEAHVTVNRVTTTRKYVVNGKEYVSLDDLPPELAAQVKQALASAGTEVLAGPATAPQATRPAKQASRIPKFEAPARSRVRVRVSPIRLALWIVAILLIILLYLRQH